MTLTIAAICLALRVAPLVTPQIPQAHYDPVAQLLALARHRFTTAERKDLTPSEEKLFRAVAIGNVADYSVRLPCLWSPELTGLGLIVEDLFE